MSMTGGYMSMAEACGEAEPRGLSFVAGIDFDPSDPEEVEIVREASRRDYQDRMSRENDRLEAENMHLRQQLIDAGLHDPD